MIIICYYFSEIFKLFSDVNEFHNKYHHRIAYFCGIAHLHLLVIGADYKPHIPGLAGSSFVLPDNVTSKITISCGIYLMMMIDRNKCLLKRS